MAKHLFVKPKAPIVFCFYFNVKFISGETNGSSERLNTFFERNANMIQYYWSSVDVWLEAEPIYLGHLYFATQKIRIVDIFSYRRKGTNKFFQTFFS